MQFLKNIKMILSVRAIVITVLAVASTIACRHFGVFADFPLSLIGTAIVFPIVFSIGGAYKRREVVLREYGNLKAHGRAIYFASRDWIETPDPASQEQIKGHLGDFFTSCRQLFKASDKDIDQREKDVYKIFSLLSGDIKLLRQKGLTAGEASRCNQFLSKMVVSFENIKHIFQYRTPRTLRAYSRVFIGILPVLYGPYFAEIAKDFTVGLVYVMPVLFTLVLTSLDNIQEHLENPFDQVGQDDVYINSEKFVSRLDL
jgi:predicted membrane chloride channel (bestrophin family)